VTGVRITITPEGAEEALAFLRDAAGRAANPRGLYDNIGAALVRSTRNRFDTGRDPQGSPWPPSIRAIAEGGQTLVDSTRLRGSITHEASNSGVEVGTNVPYASTHQFGDIILPRTVQALHFFIGDREVFADSVEIPQRAFLGLDDDDEREIVAICGEWLLGEEARS
jgi:phage virion morphogenesis protein